MLLFFQAFGWMLSCQAGDFRFFRFFGNVNMSLRVDWPEAFHIVCDFLSRPRSRGINATRLHELYGISNKTLPDRLRNRAVPKNRNVRTSFLHLANEIVIDEAGVLERLTGRPRPSNALSSVSESTELLCTAAVRMSKSDQPEAAIGLAAVAFRQAAATDVRAAVRVLPQLAYLANRHGCASIAYEHLLPAAGCLDRIGKSVRADDARSLSAAAAHIACALSEGGQPVAARELFSHCTVRSVWLGTSGLRWCVSPTIRGEARTILWSGEAPELVSDLLQNAQDRDSGSESTGSILRVRCEAQLSLRRFRKAWEMIEPQYDAVRRHLLANYTLPQRRFVGPAFEQHFHSLTYFLYGIVARAAVGDSTYKPTELGIDLSYMESFLAPAIAGGPARSLGMHRFGASSFPRTVNTNPRLVRVLNATAHRQLDAIRSSELTRLANRLLELAR